MRITDLETNYNATTELEKEVINIIIEEASDYESLERYLNDLLTYGCVSGIVSALTWYNQTLDFAKRHANEINEMLSTHLTMLGFCNPKELFGDKWDCEDSLALSTNNQNLLAWFAFEETAREIGISFDLVA